MSGAVAVQRGCGSRVAGGLYAECGLGPYGMPIEYFIIDPPQPVPEKLRRVISPRGVTLHAFPDAESPDGITYHIIDWVGVAHYENVWDFIGEGAKFGTSRRLPPNLEFHLLSERSRQLFLHPRAIVTNWHRYVGRSAAKFGMVPANASAGMAEAGLGCWYCPKRHEEHEASLNPEPCCAGIWGQDITGGTPLTDDDYTKHANAVAGTVTGVDKAVYNAGEPRLVLRKLPSTEYIGRAAPDGVLPEYELAFFMSLPISRLVVVEGDGDTDNMKKARAAKNIDVVLVQE